MTIEDVVQVLESNELHPDDQQISSLREYASALKEWNSKINLVSRADIDKVWSAHILHSLSLILEIDIPAKCRILDIGSGGGLPGIPLAIMRPDIEFVLLDSIQKKVAAVSDMISRIPVSNVSAVRGRAEELKNDEMFSRSFDVVVARAVAPLDQLIVWARPFLRKSSMSMVLRRSRTTEKLPTILALKGGDLNGEIETVKIKHRTSVKFIDLSFNGIHEAGLEDKKIAYANLYPL